MAQTQHQPQQPKEFDEKIIEIRRVSKKTKGGNKINFSALVVIGDHNSRAGVGFSKAPDVLSTIQKSIRLAKKNLVKLNLVNGTIPHEIYHKRGAAVILLKPAPEGTGVIAGGAVRAVVEAFGIRNIVSKCMGTSNKISNVYATFEALSAMNLVHQEKAVNSEKQEKTAEPKESSETVKSEAKEEPVKKEAKSIKPAKKAVVKKAPAKKAPAKKTAKK